MARDQALASALPRWRRKNILVMLLLAAILLGGSGHLDWAGGWAYLLLVAAGPFAVYSMLAKRSPDLLVERSSLQRGTKSWDKVLAPLVALVFPLVMWITAALDTRYGWSHIEGAVKAAAFILIAAGIILMLWAMVVNRFFAATVRIQKERGHTVVTGGPYAYVRHPGYVGMLAYMLATPLALDSVYAMWPAVLCAAALVLRTALEDRTLQAELDGYREYALHVRSRLIPTIW